MTRPAPLLILGALLCWPLVGQADELGPSLKATPAHWLKPKEFEGKRILIATWYTEGGSASSVPLNHVPQVLRKMGFTVDTLVSPKHLPSLERYDQLWLIAGGTSGLLGGTQTFDSSDVEKVKAFLERGKGVYSLNDNEPFVAEGNRLGKELHGMSMTGGYGGGQMIHVVAAGTVARLVAQAQQNGDLGKLAELRRAGFLNGKLYAEDHELLSGIERIFEGVTVCHMSPSKDLEVILRASDNNPLVAVSKDPKVNMLYDCGFTRMYMGFDQHSAPTSTRWYQNVAAYLQGKRRTDLATSVATQGAEP